ncbi:MAG: DUF1573 domain-containing protein [Pirellulales bacterium]
MANRFVYAYVSSLWIAFSMLCASSNAQLLRIPQEDPDAPSPYWLDDVRNCGPRCVHFLNRWFSSQHTFREVSRTCPAGRDGVSLGDLQVAVKHFGWGATPFAGDASTLPRLRCAAILHVQPTKKYDANANWGVNHFVVVLGYDPSRDEHLIFDPPRDVRMVSRGYLAERYTGLGLLVDKDSTPVLDEALEPFSPWPRVAFVVAMAAGIGAPPALRRVKSRRAHPRALLLLSAVLLGSLPSGCGPSAQHDHALAREYRASDVIEGAKITHVFQLENGGEQPFSVTNVSASCTCTHSFLEDIKQPLGPGARRPLRVEFDTRNERGQQTKRVIVETDAKDAAWQRIEFSVTATVLRPVQSIPDVTQFGSVPRGQAVARYVTIEANDDAWAGVEPRVVDGRHVRAVAQPGGNSRLRKYAFELTPPQTNGPLDDRVTFFYKQGDRELEVVVPVQADVTGLLKVLPRRILVTELDMTLGKRQHLRITAPGGQPFRLVDLELPAGVATVGERPQAAAVEHDLELEIDGAKLPADGRLIGVVTDLPEDARLEIPVVLTEHAAKKT